ncbi:MAG: hypothetical protein K2X03_29405 [Bryobacteraceae bacterium]|nr:hypothetical protein [Bryobacteraceae bacterium]
METKSEIQVDPYRETPGAGAGTAQNAKLPCDLFLWAGLGSIGLALALEISGKKEKANFVGHWAPTLLILGVYQKMLKLATV